MALHDVGKFTRSFQAMVPQYWPTDAFGPLPASLPVAPRHDLLGFYLLNDHLSAKLGILDDWTSSDRNRLFQSLAGHHGRPVQPDGGAGRHLCGDCIQAATSFTNAMLDLFRPAPLPVLRGRNLARLVWDLAGITTLADWIGSREEWFPYVSVQEISDPDRYFWDLALPRAAAALAASGLLAGRPAPFQGIRALFPGIALPSPVQAWAETATLPSGPTLAIIEDVTGGGKTEAAVTLAHRLLASGQARGVFFALPTMATANAMFGRMATAYRGLFSTETAPSLVLAHGRAALDPRFAAMMTGPTRSPGTESGRHQDPADIPAEAHCAAWLAEDRRRALLAQMGVGTIDQAILAILPVRHAVLRQQGLKGKVLVIDEAHAFDPYMQRELTELLRFHAALGGSVILLSATLPKALRQKLSDAFLSGLGVKQQALTATNYPLATLVGAASATETPCAIRDGLARTVTVTRLPDADAALARIIEAAGQGAAVAWVRNTVDDAIAAAEAVRAAGHEPLLFHARFAMTDRLAIEQDVLRRFGPGIAGERPGILIATQVIEQSLDLDFDLLVTDLAPADLLIQRAGRLWRHCRKPRPVSGPELLIISPEPVEDPAPDWISTPQPGTAAVYQDPALLWRSARAVFGKGAIMTPGDMRPLIEAAAEGEVPRCFVAQSGRAEGKAMAATDFARQNVLSFAQGYTRQNGGWDPDTHTPTRLEEQPHVTLRLALTEDGTIVPYAHHPDPAQAWSLSEVSVAAHHVTACTVPDGYEVAAALARAQWGRWERESPCVLLAILQSGSAGYVFVAISKEGVERAVIYSATTGLVIDRH